MRTAWALFLIGCGFQSRTADHPDAGSDAGILPDAVSVDLSPICPSIAFDAPDFHATACATRIPPLVRITDSTSFDTDLGTSTPDSGLTCVRVSNGNTSLGNKDVCVLAAAQIIVPPGIVLSAHGSIPFALFARSILIQGTVDVASHIGGPPGAGALLSGCIPGKPATGGGGGRGGDATDHGGRGGDDGSTTMTGATGGGSFTFNNLSAGGCGGTRGGDGTTPAPGTDDGGNTTGGAGGGALWIVSLSGELILDAGARINASGAGGAGAKVAGHGGAGGGAGGLIVLQAPSIHLDPAAVVFANGGHGGGGAGADPDQTGFTGADGSDPADPTSGGTGGTGGLDANGDTGSPGGGDGGPGFPSTARNGQTGASDGHGGGGGGGGPGAIRVVSATNITGPNVSPPPVLLQ